MTGSEKNRYIVNSAYEAMHAFNTSEQNCQCPVLLYNKYKNYFMKMKGVSRDGGTNKYTNKSSISSGR